MERLRLASTWLGGCSGCHMSFLDMDEWLIDLSQMADLVFTPFQDVKKFPDGVDVTLVEGAVCNEDHLEMLEHVRTRSRIVVSFGDCAVTVPVGTISPEAVRLLRVTEEALFQGIDAVKPGARVSDIGAAVQHHVEAQGFSVVREFVGHGIGTSLHEEPQVANYGPAGSGPRLSEGMVIAIEPMVNAGHASVKVQSDGWTAVTTDGSLSAHFEHTVVVTREGTEILTLLTEDAERARQMLPART